MGNFALSLQGVGEKRIMKWWWNSPCLGLKGPVGARWSLEARVGSCDGNNLLETPCTVSEDTIALLLVPSVDGRVLGVVTVENSERSPRISLDATSQPKKGLENPGAAMPCRVTALSKRHKRSPAH